MLFRRPGPTIETDRLILRLPRQSDHMEWVRLRDASRVVLEPWEPERAPDHLSRTTFNNRVRWSRQGVADGRSMPLFLFKKEDAALVGALTLDNIRRGPAQMGTVGYWVGERHARQGYMAEALRAVVSYAFDTLDLSRIEAGCLTENTASRSLLESNGFVYEGVAKSYLQIAGKWRDHVLYARLRDDRGNSSGLDRQ